MRGRCLTTLTMAATAVLLLLFPGFVWAVEPAPPSRVEVAVHEGRLTVDVSNAPLDQVLQAVAKAAGFELALRGDIDSRVTQSFRGVSLEEGIRRLARGHSVVVSYAFAPAEPRGEIITEVLVLEGSTSADAPPTPARVSRLDPGPAAPVTGPSMQPLPTIPTERAVEAPTSVTTLYFPPGEWIAGIQALAEEAQRGGEAARAMLADVGASEPSAEVRAQAVAALARLDGREVASALTAALGDEDASVRLQAVRGLRRMGTESAVLTLAAAAASDTDRAVRVAALRALASYPEPAVRQAFVTAAADRDAAVRGIATRTLSWWNTRNPGRR